MVLLKILSTRCESETVRAKIFATAAKNVSKGESLLLLKCFFVVVFFPAGNHSTARMLITMSREIRSHLLESYLPSTLFVIMSWGSFVVIPEIVPGRMVLLVTTLLSLVTMFDTVR